MRHLGLITALTLITVCAAGCAAADTATPASVSLEPTGVTAEPSPSATIAPQTTALTTPAPTPFDINLMPAVYGAGAVPEGALTRIGIGALAAPFSLAGDDDWEIRQSPDGTRVAIGTEAGVYVYNTADMTELWKVATPSWVGRLEWSPDGRMLAGTVGHLLIWDATSGKAVAQMTPDFKIRSFAWAPSSRSLALVMIDPDSVGYGGTGSLVSFDIASQQTRLVWSSPHQEYVYPIGPVGWSPDGGLIAAATADYTISLINTEDGAVVKQLKFDFYNVVRGIAFSPDGKLLAVWADHHHTSDDRVPIWDVASGEQLQTLTSDNFSPFSVSWSPDSTLIATGANHIAVDVWNARTGEQRAHLDQGQADMNSLRWLIDGSGFVTYNPVSGNVIRWDAASGGVGPASQSDGVAMQPFIARGRYPDIIVWNDVSGPPALRFTTVVPRDAVIWSPDGASLAVRSRVDDELPEVALWDIFSGEQKSVWRAPGDAPDWAQAAFGVQQNRDNCDPGHVFSSDGQFSAWASVPHSIEGSADARAEIEITVMNEQTGKFVNTLSENIYPVCSMAYSPSGAYLAIGHTGYPISMQDTFLTGAEASFISIRETLTGREIARFVGHTGSVYELVWSPDGSKLASVSFDGTVLVWPMPGSVKN